MKALPLLCPERISAVHFVLKETLRRDGRGAISRAEKALGLYDGYFRTQRRKRTLDLGALLAVLEHLDIEPIDFFEEVATHEMYLEEDESSPGDSEPEPGDETAETDPEPEPDDEAAPESEPEEEAPGADAAPVDLSGDTLDPEEERPPGAPPIVPLSAQVVIDRIEAEENGGK